MRLTIAEIKRAERAYAECALWAGLDWERCDESGNPRPLDDEFSVSDLRPETLLRIRRDVATFALSVDAPDLDLVDAEQMGHDLYLTRNGHGAGFWDRGIGPAGERLSEAARAMGSHDLDRWDCGADD